METTSSSLFLSPHRAKPGTDALYIEPHTSQLVKGGWPCKTQIPTGSWPFESQQFDNQLLGSRTQGVRGQNGFGGVIGPLLARPHRHKVSGCKKAPGCVSVLSRAFRRLEGENQ